jgi:bacterioferritin (cytochrome b1)
MAIATEQQDVNSKKGRECMSSQNASNQSGNFPLDNLCFDLITVIQEKSKALEAYDKYLRDAQNDDQLRQVFEQIRQQDTEHVQQLTQHLRRLLSQQSNTANSQSAGQTQGGG